MRVRVSDAYYLNNYYTNITKVYEEFIEIRTAVNTKSAERQKN